MKTDANGSIVCGKCLKAFPPAQIGLVGICKPCRDEYVAQQTTLNAIRAEIASILRYFPSQATQ